MIVVIDGPVTENDLEMAELISGITPTSFLTNGLSAPPVSNLQTEVIPLEPKNPDGALAQSHWRLGIYGQAVILGRPNPHLRRVAESCGLPIYEKG